MLHSLYKNTQGLECFFFLESQGLGLKISIPVHYFLGINFHKSLVPFCVVL
jgi:hypothetical protein